MALINCPECGKEISDKAKICPHCGIDLNDAKLINDDIVICSECGNSFLRTLESCPKCGCPTESTETPPVIIPQNIEKPKKKKSKKKKFKKILTGILEKIHLVIAGILMIACVVYAFIKYVPKDYEENYVNAVNNISSGAIQAEDAAELVRSVWYNAVFNVSDDVTDFYTKKSNGDFVEDFNDALIKLYNDDSFKAKINQIEYFEKEAEKNMEQLEKPPADYKEAYELLCEYYEEFEEMVDLVSNPHGTLYSFTDDFNDADSDLVKYYKKIKKLIEE